MLAYLLRYIGNFSSRCELLRKPTRDDAKFAWTNEQQTVFEDLKQTIMSVPVLISNYTRPLKSATVALRDLEVLFFRRRSTGINKAAKWKNVFSFYTYFRPVSTQENNDRIGLFSHLVLSAPQDQKI